ncbi:MAG: Tyrosine-specific transport protein [Chlamydiae bacterium]|nr:Tyrosine-specific transport protein [Chlamydiota bacterium]
MTDFGKILGGILLVAGTTIGAAILALPVTTGLVGFYPTMALFLIYWVLMTYAALLFLEVNLWIDDENVNIISMAHATLGRFGEVVCWILYLFLLYTLTTAYMAASGPFFLNVLNQITGIEFPSWVGPLPLIFIFSFFIYEGAKYVDYINRFLMFCLLVTFVIINSWLMPHIDFNLLNHQSLQYLPLAVALVAVSYGYHIIIPTLTRYLKRDVRALVKVILIGGVIPLIVNGIWVFVSLGNIPLEGPNGLMQGYVEGKNAVDLIAASLGHSWLAVIAQWFLFFCIATSFLGVSLSLRDFLADGLGIKKTALGRWILYFLTFIPPLFCAIMIHRAFFTALDYAGVLGVLVLLVIMPATMTWWGRYKRGFNSDQFKVPGGKFGLILTFIVTGIMIIMEVCNKLGYFQLA